MAMKVTRSLQSNFCKNRIKSLDAVLGEEDSYCRLSPTQFYREITIHTVGTARVSRITAGVAGFPRLEPHGAMHRRRIEASLPPVRWQHIPPGQAPLRLLSLPVPCPMSRGRL